MDTYTIAPDTLFSRVFHASPVAMTITSPEDGCYVDVNAAYANLVGVRRDALINRPNREYDPQELPETKTIGASDVVVRKPPEQRCRLRTAQGELRHILASSQRQVWDGREYL